MPLSPPENLQKLGFYLDGWADLIDDRGAMTDEVRRALAAELRRRNMPDTDVWELAASISLISKKRQYHAAATDPGFVTTIYVGDRGEDLYVSWRSFLRPTINWNLVVILGVIALIVGFIVGGTRQTGGIFGGGRTVFAPIQWFSFSLAIFIVEAILVALAARFWRGGWMDFFYKQPSWFDAEDAVATNLAAHHSLLQTLENNGVEIDLLREKTDFSAGRRDLRI